ncbi:MAG TPA: metallophosphoesterase [Armatimonadota bacterium]
MKARLWPLLALGSCFALVLFGGCSDTSVHHGWSFVMLGDTRGANNTSTGVSPYLNTIAQKIASLHPDLVLMAGDMCNGDALDADSPLYPTDGNFTDGAAKALYASMFANWKTAMQPVFNYRRRTGIPIYTVRGNHENEDKENAPIPVLREAYQEAFSAYVPANGPGDEQGFSWSLTHNNVTVVGADQYMLFDPTYANGTTPWSGYHTLNQAWVTQQFQQSTAPYKILMAHEPFFQTEGNGPGEPDNEGAQHFFGVDPAGVATRKVFWNNIGAAGARLYVTGHLHLLTVSSTTNDHGNPMIQLMAGNGGAPMQPFIDNPEAGVTTLYNNGNTFADGAVNGTVGFSLATVQDNKMTIQYYALNTVDLSWSVAGYTTQILPVASADRAKK